MKRGSLVSLTVMLLAGCAGHTNEDWTTSLHTALHEVTRLRVRSGGTCHRQPEAEETLLDLRDGAQIARFVQGIQIDPDESGPACECCGDPTFEFYVGDTLTVSLGFHHGQRLRWLDGPWSGDGALTKNSADFLVAWLAVQGVSGPQAERDERVRRARIRSVAGQMAAGDAGLSAVFLERYVSPLRTQKNRGDGGGLDTRASRSERSHPCAADLVRIRRRSMVGMPVLRNGCRGTSASPQDRNDFGGHRASRTDRTTNGGPRPLVRRLAILATASERAPPRAR